MGEAYHNEKMQYWRRIHGKPEIVPKRNHIPEYNKKSGALQDNVTNQVNNDKCMYSKLITFER